MKFAEEREEELWFDEYSNRVIQLGPTYYARGGSGPIIINARLYSLYDFKFLKYEEYGHDVILEYIRNNNVIRYNDWFELQSNAVKAKVLLLRS